MKQISKPKKWVHLIAIAFILSSGCEATSPDDAQKDDTDHLKQTESFSSDVTFKWMDMHLRLIRTNATPLGGLPPLRFFGYCGIALYESVVPGMPAYQTLSMQLSGMPAMPQAKAGVAYHWPTCANAALAAMNKNFFPNTSADNKASMDSLENALNTQYMSEVKDDEFQRSVAFGKNVALLIFDWSKTDGAANANAPYTPPAGPGLWAPTPPAFAPAAVPYWGKNRLMVTGSLEGSEQPLPPAYNTGPSSAYYAMVKEVYDLSQTLTPEQIAIGLYYRDNPGYGGGHYLSILKQVLEKEKAKLDLSALAYAKTGIACIDAAIGCYQVKYQINQERPIRYIREILLHPAWNPLFGTPNFPDFPSAHSVIAGSFSEILTSFFGNNYHFTNHTYDYLGMAPRSYNSFNEMATEIGNSRIYAGIHYTYSCQAGKLQGKKIGQNICAKLKFKK